ncbi:MAG: UbiX family flavin prenyltransferase [bacterium]|nr:UbiX family flavin prenyltransferase [bacterium]
MVVAVTGASGALYAVRLLKATLEAGVDVELVVSDYGKRLLIEECDLNLKTQDLGSWLDERYGPVKRRGTLTLNSAHDLGAGIASGSQRWDGMAVVPCSMKTLSSIACGASANLIERAADVTLKERRPLVLVPRETPLNVIQLENLVRVARAGAAVVPAMPAFYDAPQSFEDLADFIAGRVLSLLDVPHDLVRPWKGDPSDSGCLAGE